MYFSPHIRFNSGELSENLARGAGPTQFQIILAENDERRWLKSDLIVECGYLGLSCLVILFFMMQIEEPTGLDHETCDRARLARDPSYDGLFFSGVRTTHIYCRPVCPVRPAMSKNVTFFPTAAAAERAGFRPCLRCRPETAPNSAAWNGTATTVARGMRLIEGGFLDQGSMHDLGERLGVGPRHLLRLFLRHAGATPSEVALTRRVQAAKRLIDETAVPLSEIAFAAGFGSVRRFNEAFRNTYSRPPSSFRKKKAYRSQRQ